MNLAHTSARKASTRSSWLALVALLTFGIGPASGVQEVERRSLLDSAREQKKLALPEMKTVPSDVRDGAALFSEEAVRSAREALETIEKSTGTPVLIETIETLKGETIDEVAARLARRSGTQGVFILLARKESKLEVLPSRRYAEALPRPAQARVRSAFIESFRKNNFDEGLRKGIAAIEAELAVAKREKKLPQAEQPPTRDDRTSPPDLLQSASATPSRLAAVPGGPGSTVNSPQGKPLVIRNQVRLTLEGARIIIEAAAKHAASLNLRVNIAVVDDGGYLLSFDRMNGARPASGYTAITKATTAATYRQPAGPIPARTAIPDPLLDLSLQIAAQASGGKITTLHGGVPVVVDGQEIGAVGVGGGSDEQDAQVAREGVQAFLNELPKREPPLPSGPGRSTEQQ